MSELLPYIVSGTLLGLVAGISPGPMLALVISQTMRHNRREGIIVAGVPVVTDIPIIIVSIFFLAKLSNFNAVLGIISMLGAGFLTYLAYESISVKDVELDIDAAEAQSFKKGLITNFLNPHPYLFWITVGSPILLKAYKIRPISGLLFVTVFYIFLVGSKVAVALVVDKSKMFLKSSGYLYIVRALGVAMFIFAVLFVKEGLRLFGVLQ